MIGRVLKGKYKIYDKVGSGGFATVYLGRNLETNEMVAIKVLSAQYTNEERYLERFRREASLAERLQHPNVVRVLDHGIEEGSHYLVMEFVEGLTLEQVIERRGRLPVEEALSYVKQACAGLGAAYQAGIVHRDIKPANLMITPAGKVKIMDFGIARMDAAVGLTQSGVFIGTPRYISPEMARGGGADVRSDLYALGLLTYEMLSGTPPFDGDNPWAVLRQQIEVDPAPLAGVRGDVPAWLEAIILRAVAKNPAQRFQTPGEMLAAIEEQSPSPIGVTLDRPARPAAVTTVTAPPPAARRTPRALAYALIGVAILVVAGIVAWIALSGNGADDNPPLTPAAAEVSGAVAGLATGAATNTPASVATDTVRPSDTAAPQPTDPPSPEATATVEPIATAEPATHTPEPAATVAVPTDTPAPPPTDTRVPPTKGPTNTPAPTATPTNPPPPPVSGRIVYSAGGTLHIVSAATGQDAVSPIPGLRHPDFRRDGGQVIANGEGGSRASIVNVDATSGNILNDQSSHTDDYHPFWSPADPGRFVYDSIHHGLPGYGNMLYIQGLTSSLQVTEEDTLAYQGSQIQGKSPVWMDDDWIAFTGCAYWPGGDHSKCGIYRMPSWDDHPAMVHPGSTDMRATDSYGSQILFMSAESGDWEVYLVGSGGGQARNLSNSASSNDGLGTFSPDGKMVAFASNRGGGWAVWAVALDGSAPVKLFALPAPPTQPWADESMSWGP